MWEYMQRLVVHFSDNIAVGVGQAEQVKTDGDGIKAHGGIFFRTLCVTIIGMQFLDFFDFLTNSVMMPIAAIASCILVSRVIGVDRIAREVTLNGCSFRRERVFNAMIRVLCPVFAAVILISSIANAFGWISM